MSRNVLMRFLDTPVKTMSRNCTNEILGQTGENNGSKLYEILGHTGQNNESKLY